MKLYILESCGFYEGNYQSLIEAKAYADAFFKEHERHIVVYETNMNSMRVQSYTIVYTTRTIE